MKKSLIFLIMFLSACTTGPSVTATPAGDAELMRVLQGEVEARATQRAADQQLIIFQAGQTATALITGATSTEQSAAETRTVWRVTVAAGEAQGTATAQAGNAQATSTAAAAGTSTQISYLDGSATVESKQTVISAKQTESAPLLSAQYTAVAAQAESASLAATRERTTNQLWAWTPLILIFVGLGAGVYYLWKSGKIGIVNADDNGIMPTIIFTDTMRVLRPDLMPAPMIEANVENIVMAPDQADVTRRAQAVQAIAQLPPGYQRQALDISGNSFGGVSNAPRIEIVDEQTIQGWVDDVEGQV